MAQHLVVCSQLWYNILRLILKFVFKEIRKGARMVWSMMGEVQSLTCFSWEEKMSSFRFISIYIFSKMTLFHFYAILIFTDNKTSPCWTMIMIITIIHITEATMTIMTIMTIMTMTITIIIIMTFHLTAASNASSFPISPSLASERKHSLSSSL